MLEQKIDNHSRPRTPEQSVVPSWEDSPSLQMAVYNQLANWGSYYRGGGFPDLGYPDHTSPFADPPPGDSDANYDVLDAECVERVLVRSAKRSPVARFYCEVLRGEFVYTRSVRSNANALGMTLYSYRLALASAMKWFWECSLERSS